MQLLLALCCVSAVSLALALEPFMAPFRQLPITPWAERNRKIHRVPGLGMGRGMGPGMGPGMGMGMGGPMFGPMGPGMMGNGRGGPLRHMRQWRLYNGMPCVNHRDFPFPILLPKLPFPFPGMPLREVEDSPVIDEHISVPVRFPFSPVNLELFRSCREDKERLCGTLGLSFTPYGLFESRCIRDNVGELSEKCRRLFNVFAEEGEDLEKTINADLVAHCEADTAKYCSGQDVGTGPWQLVTQPCLANNYEALSEACKRDFDEFVTNSGAVDSPTKLFGSVIHIEVIRIPVANQAMALETAQDGATSDVEVDDTVTPLDITTIQVDFSVGAQADPVVADSAVGSGYLGAGDTLPAFAESVMFGNMHRGIPFIVGLVVLVALLTALAGVARSRQKRRHAAEAQATVVVSKA